MALFGKKKPESPGLIGVDIGAGGIKMVEVIPEEKRARLHSYAYSERKEGLQNQTPLLDDPKTAGAIMKKMLADAGIQAKRANASLPSHEVFHAIITIPQPKSVKDDVQAMIESQVKKLLPMPIEKMVLDTTIIDKHLLPKQEAQQKNEPKEGKTKEEPQIAGKHIRVLVSGASKDLVQKFVAVFKEAQLELISLETEGFALIRSLIGRDKARMMIVDIGYMRTNITIVQGGIPFLHRSIKAGGSLVTKMIAEKMSLSEVEAEQMKQDLVFSGNADVPQVLRDALTPILHEIRYSLELYKQQQTEGAGMVEKIILTGGSAHLPGIDAHLSKELDINVYLGDPWARIVKPESMKPMLDEIGPRFAVAVGLAMKELGQ